MRTQDGGPARTPSRRGLTLKQAISGVRGRLTGRDRSGEGSTRRSGVLSNDPDRDLTCGRGGWASCEAIGSLFGVAGAPACLAGGRSGWWSLWRGVVGGGFGGLVGGGEGP